MEYNYFPGYDVVLDGDTVNLNNREWMFHRPDQQFPGRYIVYETRPVATRADLEFDGKNPIHVSDTTTTVTDPNTGETY